jgi:hypothetical protein
VRSFHDILFLSPFPCKTETGLFMTITLVISTDPHN